MADADVDGDPAIHALLERRNTLAREQRWAHSYAAAAQALIEGIPGRRTAAAEAVRDAESRRKVAAGAALRGGDDRAYHDACFAVAKAERIAVMFDIGIAALKEDYEG